MKRIYHQNVNTLFVSFFVLFVLLLSDNCQASNSSDEEKVHVNGFYDIETLWDNQLKFRNDITNNVMEKLKSMPGLGYIIHSDWIELTGERSIDLSGKVLFPEIEYDVLKPIYPGMFEIIKFDKNVKPFCGVIRTDGTIMIPIEYRNIEMDQYGIITCYGKESTDVYSYEGNKVCTLPPLTETQFVNVEYHNEVQVLECSLAQKGSEINHYTFCYLDGTQALPPIDAASFNISDYSSQIQPKPLLNVKKFLLPIRKSILENRWVKNAVKNCDEKKWEEALFDIYYFNENEYRKYMSNAPECLLIASLWLRCNKELGDTETISDNYDYLVRYNLMYDEYEEKLDITPGDEVLGSKIQEQLLTECREILYPIVIPDYEEKVRQEKERQELAIKEAKAKKKEEARQRRAMFWSELLVGLGQALYNVTTTYVNSSVNNSKGTSSNVSSGGNYQGNYSSTSSPSKASAGNASSSSSSSVPQEIHEKCGVCDGTGVMYESRIKGPDVKKKCSGCSGRGYKIRYK